MTTTQPYWGGIGFALLLGVYCVVHYLRGRSVLKHWAHENGFQIMKSEVTLSFTTPFGWNGSQITYFVRVRDQEGKERACWVRCGNYWTGVWSRKTETRWKDEL